MRRTPKRPPVMILLITATLIVLLGGSARIKATRASLYSSLGGTQSAHQLAWYCPAPPVTC